MLLAFVLDLGGSWELNLPLVEFAYNNSFQTISMHPYEALYGKRCRSQVYWDEIAENRIFGPYIIARTM